jgi:hypothetical protein
VRTANPAAELTGHEESLTEFPIRETGSDFDQWLKASRGKGGSKVHRHQLYGAQEIRALRCVQPFSLAEEAGLLKEAEEDSLQTELDLLSDAAYALNTVRNIDKHRRLPSLSWRTEIIFWSDQHAVWHSQPLPRRTILTDGQVLGTFRRNEGRGRPEDHPTIQLAIHLDDDPYRGAAVLTRTLERFHQHLSRWVLPRMFWVADGNPAPIIISFAPPATQAHLQ